MRELKFICAQPDDAYYTWQVHLWLESLKVIGHTDKAIVLIFTPKGREQNKNWAQVMDLYPETEFVFYKDEHDATSLLGIYIPILRPYCLWRYFTDHPEMSEKGVFYCDSDILFMEGFNMNPFLQDDICYLSDTNSYINATYFDSKIRDVKPDKLEAYKTRDILDELSKMIGINRSICEQNNLNSGGAQYFLKNIDASFWSKVKNDCITIRLFLGNVNREFFENESKGFQSWCADMWAILWNLWLREQQTRCIPEMNFAWATDPIGKLQTHTLFHNAGITDSFMEYGKDEQGNKKLYPTFYKGKYHRGEDPTKDTHLDVILNHEESKKTCTWYYASKIKELSNKYKLNY